MPPRSPRTSCCWWRTPGATPAIGGRPACCGPSRAARRWAWARTSVSSASSTWGGRFRSSAPPCGLPSARSWSSWTDADPRPGNPDVIARNQAIAALDGEAYDVVVIGGGITGAGVALDAASRGYSVALLEREDWACGTSSRSSKLVHGGLRYLQKFDLGLVREALLERGLLVSLAPHLVRPLPMVVASFDDKRPDRLMGVGLNMYDVMATDRLRRRRQPREEEWSPDRHRVIDGSEAVDYLPALATRGP